MYVYIRSEPNLYTVGFYKPNGKWEPESDHNSPELAAQRVAWLNGSQNHFGTCVCCGRYLLLQPDCPVCGTVQEPNEIE